MKALTLWQPWASAMALRSSAGRRLKCNETRSWYTSYRGPLVIHAAKCVAPRVEKVAFDLREFFLREDVHPHFVDAGVSRFEELPLGACLLKCRLVDVVRVETLAGKLSESEAALGDYSSGRFAWITDEVEVFPVPIPARGGQLIWNWNPEEQAAAIDYPKETRGSQLARGVRKAANSLSEEDRGKLFDRGTQVVTGELF